MYKNLHYKIILIFVIFTITLMTAIGAIMISSASTFYNNDFLDQMQTAFDPNGALYNDLLSALDTYEATERQKEILRSYSSQLGINKSRNYYILDGNGAYLDGSDARLGTELEKTANLISAMAGKNGTEKQFWTDYIDYAVYLSGEESDCIIYVKDLQTEAKTFSIMLLEITVQALFIGLAVAVLLSFFLSRAITAPIQSLTEGAQKIARGEFESEIRISSDDEIGILTESFNNMKDVLKNTLDEITGERQKFETLFMYLNDGVLAFDNGGHLIHINKTARTLFSLSSEGANDQGETMDFAHMVKALAIDYEALAEKHKDSRNYAVHDVIFGEKALDITFAEFRYIERNQEKKGTMCVIHDNTSRYELDKSRREFVADVSHELRTPLTGIKGAVETVLEYPTLDAEIRDNFLNMAVEECDRMTRIDSDLLVLSRLDNNRTSWKVETFSASAFLDHLYDVMSVEAKNREHAFTKQYPADMPELTGDKEKLQQVMINILANAMKYTANGGHIHIEAHTADEGVLISVSDNGMGIPEDDLPRLFERFYRVEKARTSDAGGTGLGLAIAKEILDAHGGEIRVESVSGEGTNVHVLLPYESLLTDEMQ
jgi:two-component system sensor histidine kinase VicK